MQESIHAPAAVRDCLCKALFIFFILMYRSEHKYESASGYPTFWNHIIDTVVFRDDHLTLSKITNAHVDTLLKNKEPIKRCICSNVSVNHY
jgi:peptide methionine sulfoxide reductase MsrB